MSYIYDINCGSINFTQKIYNLYHWLVKNEYNETPVISEVSDV